MLKFFTQLYLHQLAMIVWLFIFLGFCPLSSFFRPLFRKNQMNHTCQSYRNCQIYQNQIYWLYHRCRQHSVSIALIFEAKLAFFNSLCFKLNHSISYDDGDDGAFFPILLLDHILIFGISPCFLVFSIAALAIGPNFHLIF